VIRPYVDVLRLPGALAFSAAGLLARMPISMEGLGIVLLVSATTGSYGLAGALAATFQVAASLLGPIGSRLADRYGQDRVVPVQAVVGGLGVLLFVLAVARDWPTAALVPIAAVAGAFQPNVGALVRARWAVLLSGTSRLRTAFALESILDEVIFVIGPVVATLLATTVASSAALVLAASLLIVGSLLLSVQRATQPPPSKHDDEPRPGSAIRLPSVVIVATVFILLGGVFGALEVTTVAFARHADVPAAAGPLLAVAALGSLLGGLVFGSRSFATPLPRQFAAALTILGLSMIPLPFVGSVWLLGPLLFVSGFMVAPSLIIGATLVENTVPGRQLTEAMSWTTTGIALGLALTASLSGAAIDHVGTWAGYTIMAASGLLAAIVALATRGAISRIWHAEQDPGALPDSARARD
jgi:MFS family permease